MLFRCNLQNTENTISGNMEQVRSEGVGGGAAPPCGYISYFSVNHFAINVQICDLLALSRAYILSTIFLILTFCRKIWVKLAFQSHGKSPE